MALSIIPGFLAASPRIEPTRLALARLTLSQSRDVRIVVARVDSKRRAGRAAHNCRLREALAARKRKQGTRPARPDQTF